MNKEDFLNDDSLKQLKSGEELNDFLKQIYNAPTKKAAQAVLEDFATS